MFQKVRAEITFLDQLDPKPILFRPVIKNDEQIASKKRKKRHNDPARERPEKGDDGDIEPIVKKMVG